MMLLLTVFFIILLKRQSILVAMGNIIIKIMRRMHFKTAAGKFEARLKTIIENYNECVVTLAGKKKLLDYANDLVSSGNYKKEESSQTFPA